MLQVTAGVHLDDVDLTGLGQAEVDAAVVADAQGPIGAEGDLLQPGPQFAWHVSDDGLRALVLGALLVPLCLGVEHARLAVRQPGKVHLDGREGHGLRIAQDAEVLTEGHGGACSRGAHIRDVGRHQRQDAGRRKGQQSGEKRQGQVDDHPVGLSFPVAS